MNWHISIQTPTGLVHGSERVFEWQPATIKWSIPIGTLTLAIRQRGGIFLLHALLEASENAEIFFSLQAKGSSSGSSRLWSFDGPVEHGEIYRQSPHDVDAWIVHGIARQSIPMVAIHEDGVFHVALNGSPALYGNACSQLFDPKNGEVALRSGDDGATPGLRPCAGHMRQTEASGSRAQRFSPGRVIQRYETVGSGATAEFEAVSFMVAGETLGQLRHAVYDSIADTFSPGPLTGSFGALAFATAWMNLRTNDSKKSRYWVVPAVEYSNIQYNRDAFWIASMLDPEMDRECLLNELAEIDPQAEYPLLTLIWTKRVVNRTGDLNRKHLQACLDVILSKTVAERYYAYSGQDGRHDFQYWQDSIAYAPDDVIAYNQGLLAVALRVAESLELNLGGTSAAAAAHHYEQLFNKEQGYLPVSLRKGHLFGPDCLVPDLLSQLFIGEPLLEKEVVQAHMETLNRKALTPYGYKVLCRSDGDYPTVEDLSVEGYRSLAQKNGIEPGDYQRGGSWFLYDCLCLLDGVLHGIPAAAQLLVWRIRLEMDAYGTTFEYLNTTNGEPHKSNMGWNVAIHAMMRQLTAEGRIHPEILKQIEASAS